MASSFLVRESEQVSHESFVHSALELVTSLPSSERSASFCSGRFLVTDKSAVPPPLLFSPLAYSLERRSRLVSAKRALAAKSKRNAVAEVRDNLQIFRETAASASEDFIRTVQEQILATLQAMSDFGLAVRSLFPMPDERHVADWRREVSQKAGLMFAAVIPGDSVAEIVIAQGIFNFLNIYNTVLVVRLILTWFPNPPAFILQPLATICDPYLNLFRGIIPPLGGTLDFSPILAFVVLNVFTNSAAAIPAEMPGEGGEVEKEQVSLRKKLMSRGMRQLPKN